MYYGVVRVCGEVYYGVVRVCGEVYYGVVRVCVVKCTMGSEGVW